VIEPPELVDAVREELEGALARYKPVSPVAVKARKAPR
jgi:hypothetical protein